ncbi:guanylate kinase [Paenibacillus macerans]|uniref:guanylate kinase n=1 Tax=Paenibacillus macerans TaxID=44252 RepID=UPI00204196BF|nr:guanylate kinase [Paenibacillus macerans]MCM3703766.1 guanylate kinase [Paenibacillus macerans]
MWKWLKSSKTSPEPVSTPEATGKSGEAVEASETGGSGGETKQQVIIITGTSGSGRKDIAKRLSSELGIPYVLPCTTRTPRPGEQDGEHYHFISDAEFRALQEKDELCESVRLERGSYGISQHELDRALQQRQAAIVVVNHEGVRTFRKLYGENAVRIFLYVTKEDIRLRLEREDAPPEVLEEYLRNYSEQVVHKRESDFLLQNIETNATLEKIKLFLQERI